MTYEDLLDVSEIRILKKMFSFHAMKSLRVVRITRPVQDHERHTIYPESIQE